MAGVETGTTRQEGLNGIHSMLGRFLMIKTAVEHSFEIPVRETVTLEPIIAPELSRTLLFVYGSAILKLDTVSHFEDPSHNGIAAHQLSDSHIRSFQNDMAEAIGSVNGLERVLGVLGLEEKARRIRGEILLVQAQRRQGRQAA